MSAEEAIQAISRELPLEASFEADESNVRALNAIRDIIANHAAAPDRCGYCAHIIIPLDDGRWFHSFPGLDETHEATPKTTGA